VQETTTAANEARERVVLDDNGSALLLFGQSNANLKAIEREVGLTIGVRGNELTLVGPADRVALGRSLIEPFLMALVLLLATPRRYVSGRYLGLLAALIIPALLVVARRRILYM